MKRQHTKQTAYDILMDGFKGKAEIIETLSLGETNITLDIDEYDTLIRAIDSKDYYEIKNIISKLHNSNSSL